MPLGMVLIHSTDGWPLDTTVPSLLVSWDLWCCTIPAWTTGCKNTLKTCPSQGELQCWGWNPCTPPHYLHPIRAIIWLCGQWLGLCPRRKDIQVAGVALQPTQQGTLDCPINLSLLAWEMTLPDSDVSWRKMCRESSSEFCREGCLVVWRGTSAHILRGGSLVLISQKQENYLRTISYALFPPLYPVFPFSVYNILKS